MKIDVHIRNTDTGELRVYSDEYDWHGDGYAIADEHVRFMYGEGNYSCDCNRALFFARAGGEDEEEVECSEGRFCVVKIVERGTNRIIAENL